MFGMFSYSLAVAQVYFFKSRLKLALFDLTQIQLNTYYFSFILPCFAGGTLTLVPVKSAYSPPGGDTM